jgi:hypothetical protein
MKTFENTVTIRKPDYPVFKWSFFGHILCPIFEWHFVFAIGKPDIFGHSLDRFIEKKNMF